MNVIAPITVNTDAQLISSNVPEDEYAEYAAGTTYALDEYAQVTADGIHKIYRSAVADNIGHYPPDNLYDDTGDEPTGSWVEIGATNRWAMLDGYSRAATSIANILIVELKPSALFGTLCLVNIEAATVAVSVTDPVLGLVYERTVSMADLSGIDDFYGWFFYPPVRLQTVVLTDLPAAPEATVRVTMAAVGEMVVCGEIVIGVARFIGTLLYGYQVGIRDWSVKEEDEKGNVKFIQGKYSDIGSFPLVMEPRKVYDIKRLLARFRGGRPLVWVGSDDLQETIVYARYEEFSVSIETSRKAYCTIDVEELS